MSIYVNDLLSADIEAGAKARPRYSTDIITTDGGHEIRNSRWAYPLFQFEFTLSPGYREDDAALDAFIDLFHAAGGSHAVFRFHYWRDGAVVNQRLGVGDGSDTTFQLLRSYTRGAITRDRKITRPVQGSVTVRVAEVVTVAAIDYETGIVTITPAPALGAEVRADFEHDIPVRFGDDELELVGLTDTLDQPVSVVLVEVRE